VAIIAALTVVRSGLGASPSRYAFNAQAISRLHIGTRCCQYGRSLRRVISKNAARPWVFMERGEMCGIDGWAMVEIPMRRTFHEAGKSALATTHHADTSGLPLKRVSLVSASSDPRKAMVSAGKS